MATVLTASKAAGVAPRQSERAPGFFARLLQTIAEAQQRKADREVADIIDRCGGVMHDELEGRPLPSGARRSQELPCLRPR
jgi:hypothetical protein